MPILEKEIKKSAKHKQSIADGKERVPCANYPVCCRKRLNKVERREFGGLCALCFGVLQAGAK
ncbi:hypothetical protein KW807_01580 [Candidatus Parcubacteria bacterium]|nr:hypothetical protein [Candidatus Parcubacteria bacterium]